MFDLFVSEAKDREPSDPQDRVPLRIVLLLPFVDRTIHLYDETRCMAMEVNDETIDDLLTTEMQAGQPITAQALP